MCDGRGEGALVLLTGSSRVLQAVSWPGPPGHRLEVLLQAVLLPGHRRRSQGQRGVRLHVRAGEARTPAHQVLILYVYSISTEYFG